MKAHEDGLAERQQLRTWKQQLRDIRKHSGPDVQAESIIEKELQLETKIREWYTKAAQEV